MEIMPGILKEELSDCVVYFIEELSEEFQNEIRKRLVSVCHGVDQAVSDRKIYSYKATLKEFIQRYKNADVLYKNREKGMIGELLVHILLEMDGRFTVASPFFNLEERSFKKGFDVALFDEKSGELWITEVKSGTKQKSQKNASSAIVGLINTAKNDLNRRLNEENTSLWLNAIHAAESAMSNVGSQKEAVKNLLEQCADNAYEQEQTSTEFNVVLAGALFHPMSELMEINKIKAKHSKIENEKIFQNVLVLAIQKNTFEAVYSFLESEANNEI